MVAGNAVSFLSFAGHLAETLWAEAPAPTLPRSSWVLMALSLLVIVLLGVFLLLVITHGARTARRKSNKRLPPTRIDENDWYRRPLVSESQDEPQRDVE